jgi:hypothetical protein
MWHHATVGQHPADNGYGLSALYGCDDGNQCTDTSEDLAGNTLQDVSFSDGFRYLTAANGQFYLLTDQQLALYNKNGCAAKGSVGSDSRIVVVLDGDPLVVGLTAISACDWENEAG